MDPKNHKIIFSPSAERDIARFSIAVALWLVRDIKDYLETNPLPFSKSRIKKLTGYKPPLYRLRSGDYRAYYRITPDAVVVLAITNKKDSEKILKKIR